jgi:hypothetical protein
VSDVDAELASLEQLAAAGYLTPAELDAARARLVAPAARRDAPPATVITKPLDAGPATTDDPVAAVDTPVGGDPDGDPDGDPPAGPPAPREEPPTTTPPSTDDPLPPAVQRRRSPRVVLAVVAAVAAVALGVGLVSNRDGDEGEQTPASGDEIADIEVTDGTAPSPEAQTTRPASTPAPPTEQMPPPTTQPRVPLPDTVGLALADARAELAAAGFDRVIVVERASGTTEQGTVIRQVPGRGDGDPARTVRLTIAAAPTPTPTPTPTTPTYGIVTVLAEHPSAAAVATMFETWTTGINTRDYGLSFSQYTGRLQQQVGFDAFASGNRSSQIVDFTVESVLGDSTLAVLATFTSRQDAQDGFDGQTCSVWRMEYEILSEADLLINRVRERTGGPDAC